MLQPQYQSASLYAPTGKTWLIVFYCLHPVTQTLDRLRFTFDLNRVKCTKERRRCALAHIANINTALQNGWNYFIHVKGLQPKVAVLPNSSIAAVEPVSISQAMERALKVRLFGTEDRTQTTYRSFVTTFCAWLSANDLDRLPVDQFTADHFQEYLYYKSMELGHGNRNINDTLGFFKTTFEVLRKKKLLSENPLRDLDYLQQHESTLFTEITGEELRSIAPALLAYNPRFYLFTKFIACNFIRPHHIARLKAGQIDYAKDLIYLDAATTKNKKVTQKQLSPDLKKTLLALGCDKIPGNQYLFTNTRFEPGEKLYRSLSVRAAELWHDIVIEGLGINKKMYALKHTAGTYLVNENDRLDLVWLSSQMEHGDLAVTEHYVKNRKVKKIDQGGINRLKY